MALQVQNVALTGQAALRQTAEQLERESKELQDKLTLTLNKFGAVKTDADIVEAEVIDSVSCSRLCCTPTALSHTLLLVNRACLTFPQLFSMVERHQSCLGASQPR